jgi:hypothetical protein
MKQYPVQEGIGTSVPKSAPKQESAPNANPATNNPSGSSQSHNRGKQGE